MRLKNICAKFNKIVNLGEPLTYEWFEKHHQKGRVKDSVIGVLRGVIESLNHVYGDNWELQAIFKEGTTGIYIVPVIIIKFDEVLIKNSKDQQMILDDLYVRFEIISYYRNDGNYTPILTNIQGIRQKISVAERNVGYFHSHISSKSVDENSSVVFSDFCLGSSGISELMAIFSSGWRPEMFTMFLFNLKDYVSWESIEGGPHILMGDVLDINGEYMIQLNHSEIADIMSAVDTHLLQDDFDIQISDSSYAIVDNNKLSQALVRILPEKYHVLLSRNGTEYSTDEATVSNVEILGPRIHNFYWKGEKVSRVEITNRVHNRVGDLNISGVVKELVMNYLNAKIFKKILYE